MPDQQHFCGPPSASACERGKFLREADDSWEAYQRDGWHLTGDEVSAWLKKLGKGDESEMPECHL